MSDVHSSATMTEAENTDKATKAKATRKKAVFGIVGVVALAGIGFGGYEFFIGNQSVSTDNAYVGAYTATITPMIGGSIAEVMVTDAQSVRKGDILFRIDDKDAQIALAQAEADLAKMRRQFGQTSAIGSALNAQVGARDADIARARAESGPAVG